MHTTTGLQSMVIVNANYRLRLPMTIGSKWTLSQKIFLFCMVRTYCITFCYTCQDWQVKNNSILAKVSIKIVSEIARFFLTRQIYCLNLLCPVK